MENEKYRFAGKGEEYTALRQEMISWLNRLSMIYSFSFAAIALILNVQLTNAFGEHPNCWAQLISFIFIVIVTTVVILLVVRTDSLIKRQASYMKVSMNLIAMAG